jgi:hypothetical protein
MLNFVKMAEAPGYFKNKINDVRSVQSIDRIKKHYLIDLQQTSKKLHDLISQEIGILCVFVCSRRMSM